MQKTNYIGRRVGNLTIVRELPPTRAGNARWVAKCDCGKERETSSSALRRLAAQGTGMCNAWCEKSKSLIRQAVVRHGKCQSPEYRAWARIKNRCFQKANPSYSRYGGSGITMDTRWRKDFNAFLQDMGEMPHPRMSIDRIDNSKGYFPNNCRWATPKEQANNRCDNLFIDTPWGKMTVSQASDRSGVPYSVLMSRIRSKSQSKDWFRPVRKQNEKFKTQWGELTIKEACAKTGLSPKIAWSRLARGITDPDVLFSTKDLRKEKP